MGLSVEKYMPYLVNLELDVIEKEEIIRTVWTLMQSQADIAFGRHSVQIARGYVSNDNLQSPAAPLDSNVIPFTKAVRCNEE